MKYFGLLVFLLLSSNAAACDPALPLPEYCVEIVPAFGLPTKIALVANVEGTNGILVEYIYEQHPELGFIWGKKISESQVKLNESSFATLIALFEKGFPVLSNDMIGEDGSMWYVERRFPTYLKVGYWSPKRNTEKRGLSNFVKLVEETWKNSNLDERFGDL